MSSVRERLWRRLAAGAGVIPACDKQLMYEAKEELEQQKAEIERLMEEITDGDYWHKRATQAIENGTCPICFSGDEGGHKDGCLWGEAEDRADQLEEEIERLQTDRSRAEDELDRLRRRGAAIEAGYGQQAEEIERLKKAVEDADVAGFKEGFNSAENQLAELKADNERLKTIITSNLHERTCHECGKLEWTTKNIGHLHTCDECYLKFLGRLRGT